MLLSPIQIDALIVAVARASQAVMTVYESADFGTKTKGDGSPVTAADLASHEMLSAALTEITPDYTVVSEEGELPAEPPNGPYWLVDPLDGTKEFLNRNGQFTVNIGLVANSAPVFGIVAAPVLQRLWVGDLIHDEVYAIDEQGGKEHIQTRSVPPEGLTVMRSRSHLSDSDRALIDGQQVAEERALGSSLKFCLVAEGGADLYPRNGRTMEWDSAAAHAVLLAAGGRITRADAPEQPLGYGKPDFANDCGFIVWGR